MNRLRLGFLGAGKMAGAIIGGVVRGGLIPPEQIGVYDVLPGQTQPFAGMGCHVFADIPSLAAGCEILFLAVKPQSFPDTAPGLKQGLRSDTLVVSIMAGVGAEAIRAAAGFDCKLVLTMPNTPLLLGQGATALARVEPATPEEFAAVKELFAAAGAAEEIVPGLMREVIPVNGSSPAFVYLLAKTLIDCAAESGIDPDAAKSLVIQTLIGSAHMLRDSGYTPQELIDMVCSPGGTTLAALDAMEKNGFSHALREGFAACVRRAEELAK